MNNLTDENDVSQIPDEPVAPDENQPTEATVEEEDELDELLDSPDEPAQVPEAAPDEKAAKKKLNWDSEEDRGRLIAGIRKKAYEKGIEEAIRAFEKSSVEKASNSPQVQGQQEPDLMTKFSQERDPKIAKAGIEKFSKDEWLDAVTMLQSQAIDNPNIQHLINAAKVSFPPGMCAEIVYKLGKRADVVEKLMAYHPDHWPLKLEKVLKIEAKKKQVQPSPTANSPVKDVKTPPSGGTGKLADRDAALKRELDRIKRR